MAMLSNILSRNSKSFFLSKSRNQVTTTAFKRFFSSQESSWQSIVGSPQLPLPGTPAYSESIERLTTSRFLVHSSGQPATENETKDFLIEAIRNLQNQNSAIYSEVKRLRQQVDILQAKTQQS